MQKKKLSVTIFVSEIKRVENYPDFEKLGALNSAWSTTGVPSVAILFVGLNLGRGI